MLRVDLEDFDGNTAYAQYNMFGVMGENDKYKLKLGNYSGESLRFYSLSCRNNAFINSFSYAYKILGLKQQLGLRKVLKRISPGRDSLDHHPHSRQNRGVAKIARTTDFFSLSSLSFVR